LREVAANRGNLAKRTERGCNKAASAHRVEKVEGSAKTLLGEIYVLLVNGDFSHRMEVDRFTQRILLVAVNLDRLFNECPCTRVVAHPLCDQAPRMKNNPETLHVASLTMDGLRFHEERFRLDIITLFLHRQR